MTDDTKTRGNKDQEKLADKPQSAGRRAMLRGTAVAMPAILTLQSGAALARSSNLISGSGPGTRDRYGRTLCLDTRSVYPMDGNNRLYDLGEPAYARVNAIREREYRYRPRRRSRQVDESEMCERGIPGYYRTRRGGDWKKVETRGMIVSATALHSFAGHVHITDL